MSVLDKRKENYGWEPKKNTFKVDLIESINMVMNNYNSLTSNPNAKLTYDQRTNMRRIVHECRTADLYHLDHQFDDMLDDYWLQYENLEIKDVRLSAFTRLPSPLCAIMINYLQVYSSDTMEDPSAWSNKSLNNPLMFMCQQFDHDNVVEVRGFGPMGDPIILGGYHPSYGMVFPDGFDDWEDPKKAAHLEMMVMIAGSFEIINHPRFVLSEPSGPRQQRRKMMREHSIPVDAWHKISWDISEPVVSVDPKGGRKKVKMPLHYNRGYFKRAEPHWDNVVQWKDGTWKQWVDGYWAGHPAYGIKKGYHAPKLGKAA